MIVFKTNDSNFELPTRWGELTFEQFYKLQNSDGSFLSLIEILTGIDKKVWQNSDDLMIKEKLLPYLEWMSGEFDLQNYIIPDYLIFSGKKYPCPKDINKCTAGQKWHLEDALQNRPEGMSDIQLLPIALAVYFQPLINESEYDSDKVDALVPEMNKLKLEDGWGIASFFLLNFVKSWNEKQKVFDMNLHRKRLEQELTDLKSSESFQRFSVFRRFFIKLLSKLYSRITPRFTPPSFISMNLVYTKNHLKNNIKENDTANYTANS